MQKFWDMVLSHFLSFTVVVLEVMIFQNKKSVVLEVGKNHKDCFCGRMAISETNVHCHV